MVTSCSATPRRGRCSTTSVTRERCGRRLELAGIDRPVRPFHDGRHSNITNAAAAGVSPAALQAQAGHSSFSTTQGYIDLAGVTFTEEAALAEARLFGEREPAV